MACNYCGADEYEIIQKYTRFEKNNVLQCKNCGLVYLELKQGKNDIESFYKTDYRKDTSMPVQSPQEHFKDNVTRLDAENRITFISRNEDIKNKSILEIGSGSGSLLVKLKEYGATTVEGIELGLDYSNYSSKLGFNIHTKPIETLNFKEKYDIIVSFHTLEHLYDPMTGVNAINKALKKGGCFLGEVPNQHDWRIQIFNNEIIKRLHYDPNHYYYYSPKTLTNYLTTCGFHNIKLETVERYNSIRQLRSVLCTQTNKENIDTVLKNHIFPKDEKDDTRLPNINDKIETKFNRIFGNAVNSEMMGNCLRWVACK